MHLIAHGAVPSWVLALLIIGSALLILAVIAGAVVENSSHAWLVGVAASGMGLGCILLLLGGFVGGAISAQLDKDARTNLISQGQQVYDLHLTDDQAQHLLQHNTITLNDGRQIRLHHLRGNLFGFNQLGRETALLPTSGMPLGL